MPDVENSNSSLQSYFRLNAESYSSIIDGLLEKLPPSTNPELTEARRDYFETAIAKAADLTAIPPDVALMNPAQLKKAAEIMPDKEAQGWTGITSLSRDDRESFSQAGQRRPEAVQWNNLFPEGKNEIVLPLSANAHDLSDKVSQFIETYNHQSQERLEAARRTDEQARERDPDARVTAGSRQDQRQVRLDPTDSSKLQMFNTKKDAWEAGPKLGKFLQDNYAWELYDAIQVSSDLNARPRSSAADKNLESVANHDAVELGNFDPRSLRVVVSRDPQKIGEMSTGQRWASCMAKDGINYHFVPQDIAAGSLVAYLVHQDDPDARYPLARQLIKPFHNAQTNETILVPAKIYGSSESSYVGDALKQTLGNFVLRQNQGKNGEFSMDTRLYPDGQATVARLQGEWSPAEIRNAVLEYQNGALQEWSVELNDYRKRLARGEEGAHGENPKETIKKLESKIERVFDPKNAETGLPRMFFREMVSSSIGTIPEPKDIRQALADDPQLKERYAAFKALEKLDLTAWDKSAGRLPAAIRAQTAIASLALAGADSDKQQFAKTVLTNELTNEDLSERVSAAMAIAKYAPAGEVRQGASYVLLDDIPKLPTANERVAATRNIIEFADSDWFKDGIARIALKNIPELATAKERVDATKDFVLKLPYGSLSEERALGTIMTDAPSLPTIEERYEAATIVLALSQKESPLNESAAKFLINQIPELPSADARGATAVGVLISVPRNSPLHEEAHKLLLEIIPQMSTVDQRIAAAIAGASHSDEGSPLNRRSVELVLENINSLPSAKDRSARAETYLTFSFPKSSLNEGLADIVLKDIPELQSSLERYETAGKIRTEVSQDSPSWRKASEAVLDNIEAARTASERIRAATDILAVTADASLKERAANSIIKYIPELPHPRQRVQAAVEILAYTANDSPLHEKAADIIFKAIPELPNLSDRDRAVDDILTFTAKDSPTRKKALDIYHGGSPEEPSNSGEQLRAAFKNAFETSTHREKTEGIIHSVHNESPSDVLSPDHLAAARAAASRIELSENAGASSTTSGVTHSAPAHETHSTPSEPSHPLAKLAGVAAAAAGAASHVHMGHTALAAGGSIGLVMGVNGVIDKLHDANSNYHNDERAGGERANLAHAGIAVDVANIGAGAAQTAHQILSKPEISSAIAEATKIAENAPKGLGVIGKAAGPAGLLLTVASGAIDTKAAVDAHDGHRAAQSAGGAAGALAGGIAGAEAGALVGSVVPVVGTAIGGVVGGIGGAIFGGWLGGKAADAAAGDAWDKKLHEHDAPKAAVEPSKEHALAQANDALHKEEQHRKILAEAKKAAAQVHHTDDHVAFIPAKRQDAAIAKS